MIPNAAILQLERKRISAIIKRNRLVFRKSIELDQDVNSLLAADNVKARPQSIFRNHSNQTFFALQIAAVRKQSKNRIVRYDRRSRAQPTAVSQIDCARIPPRTAP